MPPADSVPVAEQGQATLEQVERILQSATFRNAEGLRRLLKFLADKYVAGEADLLKEYSVGIDGLGKPSDYDPRQDSSVRIQTGRLRHKLADYYRTEGQADPLILELPKGHYKLSLAARALPEPGEREIPVHAAPSRLWQALALASVAAAALATVAWWQNRQETAIFRGLWTAELEELWRPFLATQRPLIIAIEDPPFVQFKDAGVYREMALNRWEDIVKSPNVVTIRKALKDPAIEPNFYYAPMGEVSASFLVGRLLGPRVPALSLARSRAVSLQQLSANNVLYVGAAVFFEERLASLPVDLDLSFVRGGVRNAKPGPGEMAMYEEQLPTGTSDNGEIHAIVTHIPGPSGSGEVTSFTSMRTPGRLAAVQAFTDPEHAQALVQKMRGSSGTLPRYYQLLLKVKYKEGVPTETSYVLHHEIQPRSANSHLP